jgi:hypothetical protein
MLPPEPGALVARSPGIGISLSHRRSDQASVTNSYTGIEKAIAKLDKLPKRHPIVQDETEQLGVTLRRMLYGRRPGVFRILFSIEGDTITLLYVRHSARGPIEPPRE